MENESGYDDPTAAAAQLAALRADRERLAERVRPPWWYDPGLGVVVFLMLASLSLRGVGPWQFVSLAAGVLLLGVLGWAYQRITGLWVSGLRRGRTRKVIYVWFAVYSVVLALAGVAEFAFGVRGAVAVGGAVLGAAITLLSRRWTRVYAAELRESL
jgi:hypothetical protein